MTNALHVGRPISRVDGPAKVTGAAKYAAEYQADGLAYGVVVSSAIAKGRIARIGAEVALAFPGVIQVFTHENRPSLAWFDRSYQDEVAPPGSPFRPLYDDKIVYSGQPVALVVAETFEAARYAASLVEIAYEEAPHETQLEEKRNEAAPPKRSRSGYTPPPKPKGDPDGAFDASPVKLDVEYRIAVEHHNPMEPHATTVTWDGDGKITVYEKTQGAQNSQGYITGVFGFSKSDVRVLSPYVGGAFGSGLRPQYQLFMAVMAARELKRSVRVSLTRQQMFTFGYRPRTIQTIALAAERDGTMTAIKHDTVSNTSQFEEYMENVVTWAGLLYKCDNMALTYRTAPLDYYTPADMRAPGAASGMLALESAIDELSYAVGMDPIQFRLKNYSERDQNTDKPFSSKELRACFAQGAERFGWAKRSPAPRSMREGKELVGWGMASGCWEAMMMKTSARAVLKADGSLEVATASADIGTGTYTIMSQIAADTLGVDMAKVTAKLGDSSLPTSPVEGGSWAAASVGSAVKAACDAVREKLFKLARSMDGSPLANTSLDRVTFSGGRIHVTNDPAIGVTIAEAMRSGEVDRIEEEVSATQDSAGKKFSSYTHSAIFVEVKVDEQLGVIRLTRVVNAVAAGHILNPKTARSQILGGTVWGISMALHEESMTDHRLGRFMNHNLAEYHIPVNADIHDIDVIFVQENDEVASPIGVKGLGEIGIVGTGAAVGNAIYHATGKRIRDYPITIDKLLV